MLFRSVFRHVLPSTRLCLEYPRETGLILRCTGKGVQVLKGETQGGLRRLGKWLLVALRISVGKPQEVSEPRELEVVTLPGPVASRRWAGGHRLQNHSVFGELKGEIQLSSGASEVAVSGEEKL